MFPKWYRAVCCRLRDSRATMVITRLETLPCAERVPRSRAAECILNQESFGKKKSF